MKEILQEIIKEEIETLHKKETTDKLLSIDEVRKMFSPKISRGTVNAWTKQGLLNRHIFGKSVRYLYSEVIAASNKIKKFERRDNMWKIV